MSPRPETLEKGPLDQQLHEKPRHRCQLPYTFRKHRSRWHFGLFSATLLSLIVVISCALAKHKHHVHLSVRQEKHQRPLNLPLSSQQPHEPTSLVGPTIPFNFPDPAILSVNGTSYAFGTNTRIAEARNIHIQVATSYDNLTWSLHSSHDALPYTGDWARSDGIWAPDVILLPDQTFVMYYAAAARRKPGTHCIGAATSTTPLGPYTPLSKPITCPIHLGGAIDPDGFLDPSTGRRYISYKIDGNNIGHGGSCRNEIPPLIPTPLLLLEVNATDGITPITSNTTTTSPIELLDRIEIDGPLIEAPSLYLTSYGIYFLFYSSGCFSGKTYDVKYATATNITGPWSRAEKPLLRSGVKVGCRANTTDNNDNNGREEDSRISLVGPGGMDVFMDSYSYSNTSNQTEETLALFHGILTADQLPDGYDYESIIAEHHQEQDGGWRDTLLPSLPGTNDMPKQSDTGTGREMLRTQNQNRKRKRSDGMPIKPKGVVRGMYQGRIRFEGREAWFI